MWVGGAREGTKEEEKDIGGMGENAEAVDEGRYVMDEQGKGERADYIK
jgi:hypothetical protein